MSRLPATGAALLLTLACTGDAAPPQADAAATPTAAAPTTAAATAAAGHHPGDATAAAGGVLSLDVTGDGSRVDVLLAVAGEGGGARLVHRRSMDGGRSWSGEHEVDLGGRPMHSPHRGMDPQIAAHGDRLLAVWTTPGTSEWGSGPMATSSSADGGRTWAPGPTPADDGRTDGHNYIDVVADPDGAFHAVWLDTRERGRGVSWARSEDGGASWSPSRTVDGHACECCWNRIYPLAGRKMVVLYRDKLPTDLALGVSGDGGASWRLAGYPGAFGWRFPGCPHVGGALAQTGPPAHPTLHALSWTGRDDSAGLWLSTSRDGGEGWSVPQRIGSELAKHGDLAAVGDRVVAVWDEGPRIFAAWPGDASGRSVRPTRISAPGARATHPLVVAADGAAVAMWTETTAGGSSRWRVLRIEPPDPAGI